MKGKTLIFTSLCLTGLITVMAMSFSTKNKISVTGVWKVVAVQTVKPNGTFTLVYPTESEVIFTGKRYSFCWTNHMTIARNWQMPDSAKLARINQSIVNGGTYELNDSILTTKASFAINPMFVNGIAKFKYAFTEDTLVLTGISLFSSDNIPHPLYASGAHIVNKLVKISDK